ncbi:MAG: glycoside hydrolase family 3 C-terminal domain-containing protein [Acetatifactor sp.]|nr:glycoside hydrolase family 3 C-terminal domain-containing protein [Acetatifactor sp.]
MKMPNIKASLSDEITAREVENREVAYSAAVESIVLLKNDGALPVAPCNIALFGSAAVKMVKGGTGSGEVNERHVIDICEGLKKAGFSVYNENYVSRYISEYETEKEKFKKQNPVGIPIGKSAEDMINIMANPFKIPAGPIVTYEDVADSKAEICIYAVARQAGECADRSLSDYDFTFMPREVENLKFLAKHFEKLILVINAGGSMDMSVLDEIPEINAVIFLCQQGMESGRAFADILTGKANPSGALTDTWVNSYYDVPGAGGFADLDGNPRETDYGEGIFVGYRCYDTFGANVRYPFGYGLSYSEFKLEYRDLVQDRDSFKIDVSVTNVKGPAGKKIVQVYAACPEGKLAKERKRLVGFGKSSVLQEGESERIGIFFDFRNLSSYDEAEASYVCEPGKYVILIGENCEKVSPVAYIEIQNRIILSKCKNICPCEVKFEELDLPRATGFDAAGLTGIVADTGFIKTEVYDYGTQVEDHDEKAEKLVENLTIKEKLTLLSGTGFMGAKDCTLTVPGAAAYTAAIRDKNIPSVALCDGPAGLRLQRVSAITKKGAVKPMEMMMDFMNEWPEFIKKMMTGDAKKDTLIYQNATSFPVGTALAQTWNVNLLEKVGDAVGREMEEFGATFWLAPGMNIHRNPLCGRNYEYFSEDPLLTGLVAAAISRGVQSHRGKYVTIKHFACNNQETSRAGTSANLSERALREIYLEGFRLAVKKGGAKAVMTSYNKVNHVYTPNSHDLCTKVLRNEWGFKGVVMTDWMSTSKGLAGRADAYKAGNDLIMPGGNGVIKECLKDYKAGKLTDEDINICLKRVLDLVMEGGMDL